MSDEPLAAGPELGDDLATLGLFVLLQLLGETRVELGLDGDASAVFDRSIEIGGAFRAIGLGPAAGEALAVFRQRLTAAEPAISRLAEKRGVTRHTP